MFSDTITYTDFDGNEQSETLYFNMSKTEGIKFYASVDGGYDTYLQSVLDMIDKVSDSDPVSNVRAGREIFNVYEDIILASYGERSEDGKRFMKSDGITNNFKCSAAYDAFFMKFFDDPEYGLKFITAVLPNETGMSSDEIITAAKQDSKTIDLTDRFKAKIEEKKLEASTTE